MIDLDAKIREKRVDALSDAVKELLSGMLILSEEVEKLEEKIEKLEGLKERVDAIEAKAGVDNGRAFRFAKRPLNLNSDKWRGLAEIVVFIGDEAYQAKRDHAPYRNRIPLADDKGVLHEEAYGSYVRLLWESADRTESRVIGFVEKIGYVVLDPQYVPNRYCYAYRATTNFPYGPNRTFEDRVFVNNDHESYELARGWVIAKWEAHKANETKHE